VTAAAQPSTDAQGRGRFGWIRSPWTLLVFGSLAVAALTLLYPSTPTYDPWAWIIWGREIFNLDLVTSAGPSWKPLPVIFTTLFAPFGEASPDMWLVVARAGGLLALAGGFRVSTRLVEQLTFDRVSRWSLPAGIAGVIAVIAMIVQSEFVKSVALGNSEGLLVASVLFAVDRHFDEDRRGAMIFAGIAGLFRPELWLFLGPYGLYVFWKDSKLRPLVVGIGVALPVLWFVPEYIGSGDFLRAANRAQDLKYLPYSPAFAPDPTQAILDMTRIMVPRTVWWLASLGAVMAVIAAFGRRFKPLGFALLPAAWVALVARMTETGFAGNPRYLLIATSMFCVLSGAGIGSVLGWVQVGVARFDRRLARVAVVAVTALVVGLSWGGDFGQRWHRWEVLDSFLRNEHAHRAGLPEAVVLAGGSAKVDSCGLITTNNFQVPMVSWYLDLHIDRIGLDSTGPGTAFQTKTTPRSKLDPPTGPPGGRVVGVSEPWIVWQKCAAPAGNG